MPGLFLRGIPTQQSEKNPNLQRLLFYTNQEFSESSKKNQKGPKYKTELEEFAGRQGLRIEWRVPSHFEAQLAPAKNSSIAEYFFSLEYKAHRPFLTPTESLEIPIGISRGSIDLSTGLHIPIMNTGSGISMSVRAILCNLHNAACYSTLTPIPPNGTVNLHFIGIASPGCKIR